MSKCSTKHFLNNDDGWGGEGIDANNESNSDANLDCTFDFDTDVEGNDKGDIGVLYAKIILFLDYVNKLSTEVCNHPGLILVLMRWYFPGLNLLKCCPYFFL